MSCLDPNLLTLHVSKIASVYVKNNRDETEVILQKLCYKKIGGKTDNMKTEIDWTLSELELLCEAIQRLEYFFYIKSQFQNWSTKVTSACEISLLMTDHPDCTIDLSNKMVFDNQNQESSPWNICCAHIERSLIICVVHSFLLLIAIICCFISITYNQYSNPQIWSILRLFLGCLVPTPK